MRQKCRPNNVVFNDILFVLYIYIIFILYIIIFMAILAIAIKLGTPSRKRKFDQ